MDTKKFIKIGMIFLSVCENRQSLVKKLTDTNICSSEEAEEFADKLFGGWEKDVERLAPRLGPGCM